MMPTKRLRMHQVHSPTLEIIKHTMDPELAYKDYSIANEAFLSEYVPISCCDLTKYTWYHCLNASSTQRRLDCNLKISFDQQKQLADIYFSYAYTTGCADRLQNFIFPLLIILFTTNAGLEMICMFALSCYLKFSTDLALDDTDDIGSDKIAAAQDNGEATSQKKLDATPKNRIVRLKQPVVNETTPWIDENEEEEEEEATNEA
ncbi:unnamed protein product [Protopolystoma xenopodis]|uniref:Uncharacterized protein n=1 Tax=Protopolystoma xenopodis TaxID=117903 RepID=A0A448WFL9_9PLAT|nr:unnamed protein product [Protopolystoma xenopodis]